MSTQEALILLEQLDSYISGDDSNDEGFRVNNVNLQKRRLPKAVTVMPWNIVPM